MRARRAAIVIEGEAVVLERRIGQARASARVAPDEPRPPGNDNRTGSPLSGRGGTRPDLVFGGAAGILAFGGAASEPRPHSLVKALSIAAAALLLVALVGGLLAAWGRDAALGDTSSPHGRFELSDVASTLIVRPGHPSAVVIQGRISNRSASREPMPTVVVRVPGKTGTRLAREFRPAGSFLRAGETVRFHSTLALASATTEGITVRLRNGTAETSAEPE